MLYMTPLLVTNFVLLGLPTLPQLLVILLALFLLAVGISGVSISIAVSTTSFEKFVTARGVVYYMFFFCSSVFYPMSIIRTLESRGLTPLVRFAEINPLTNGADLIRSFLLGAPVFSTFMLVDVAVFSTIFALCATFAYAKILMRR